MTTGFKGKAIYNPSGKAGEYSYWAANFYNGCSARCEYCYNRHGRSAKVVGGDEPTLKKSLVNEDIAFSIFRKEACKNIIELKKHGLFFNFVSDPCLRGTFDLNNLCWEYCAFQDIAVKVLTKQTWWVDKFIERAYWKDAEDLISFGFTLTGHDDLEPGAATNAERIAAMKKLHDAGFKTWASIEPIIDFESSFKMISDTNGYCDFYKIGLKSGKKYNQFDIRDFMQAVVRQVAFLETPVYFKESLLNKARFDRKDLPSNCVNRDFNL